MKVKDVIVLVCLQLSVVILCLLALPKIEYLARNAKNSSSNRSALLKCYNISNQGQS